LTDKSKLEIKPLYESAFADIKDKVSVDNVVDEVFSWVPSRWVPSFSPAVRSMILNEYVHEVIRK